MKQPRLTVCHWQMALPCEVLQVAPPRNSPAPPAKSFELSRAARQSKVLRGRAMKEMDVCPPAQRWVVSCVGWVPGMNRQQP